MSEFLEVCLVDGVGNPRAIAIKREPVDPITIRFPHPQTGAGEAQVQVKFDRSPCELDAAGRQVYRMRGGGAPAIRERQRSGVK